MSLKTMVVHARSDRTLSVRLALAAALAEAHGAKLRVVFALQAPSSGMVYAEHVPAEVIQARIEAEKGQASSVRARVEDRLSRTSVAWEWRVVPGPAEQVIAADGATADLIVMGHDGDDAGQPSVAAVALAAGRPVLCVTPSGTGMTCGRRVLVAWNGTREATRAVHDALPLLRAADNVILFSAAVDAEPGVDIGDVVAHLASHGVTVEARHTALGTQDPGAAILAAAADADADLIVMGAYGHSRLREWAFGGATRTILAAMAVPTLLSH